MMSYWGWGFPNKPIRKNGTMSDDLTVAYLLGVEDMRSRLHKQADEIERLRAENEKLKEELKQSDGMLLRQAQTIRESSNSVVDPDLLDDDEKDAITLHTLKSSYESIAYSYRDSIDEEDRRYHQGMLDTLDEAIEIFSKPEELEDWNSKKAGLTD